MNEKSDADKQKPSLKKMDFQPQSHNDTPFELIFVDDKNDIVSVIENLTEGEARWMADVLLRERSFWFR